MGDEAVIRAQDVRLGYPEKVTLEQGSIAVRPGEITCIIGSSGCGKSTLLKTLIGLLPPLAGRVEVLGEELYALDEPERDRLLSRLGVMFQGGALLNSISLLENVMIPLREHTRMPEAIMAETARLWLRQVGLEHAAPLSPAQLSGGMKKRAAIARALALDPRVLLCDEPSAGLDPVTGAQLDSLLLELRAVFGLTIVVVTHELYSIRRIADSIVMLGRGRVLYHGSLEGAVDSPDPDLQAFFGRQAQGGERRRPLLAELTGEET